MSDLGLPTSIHPRISVVIPTYSRPKQLARCLESMAALDYPSDRFEVVVVDDGSPTSLEGIVALHRDGLDIRLIRQDNAGPAAARNRGASEAVGTFLAFTDDDCAPDPQWLSRLADRFAQEPDQLLGGRTVNVVDGNPYSAASQTLIDYLYHYYNRAAEDSEGEDRRTTGTFFASNNIACSAEPFRRFGGFDTSFPLAAGEDREFCDRWGRDGLAMSYVPEAVVYHAHTMNLRGFLRQHFNYGRGAFHFHVARARKAQQQMRVEPLRFYAELLRYPLTTNQGLDALRITVLMGLSQTANVAGYVRERFGSRRLTT